MIEPRVWMGRTMDLRHWSWSDGHWFPNCTIYAGDIFAVCDDEPEPDPAKMASIATCSVVDWTTP